MRTSSFLLFLCLFWTAASPCRAYVFSIVMEKAGPSADKALSTLRQAIPPDQPVNVFELSDLDSADPIRKGQFLSRIAAGDLVITLGEEASERILSELEDSNIFFVGAGKLSDEAMESPNVSGILPFSPQGILQAARKLFPRSSRVGVIYTRGYAPMAAAFQNAAGLEGLSVVQQLIREKKDIGPAARQILSQADMILLMGQGDLAEDYILNQAIARLKPAIVPDPADVRKGGFFCLVPDAGQLNEQAAKSVKRLIENSFKPGRDRIGFCGPTRTIAVNRRLAQKLDAVIPKDLRIEWIQ